MACHGNRVAGVVVSIRPAAIRRSRRYTRSSEGWGEGTVDPSRLRLARVKAPTIPGSLAVVAAAAARLEDCLEARIACKL